MVVQLQEIDFHVLQNDVNLLFYNYVLNISVIQCIHFKQQLEIGVVFLYTFVYNICNIIQEPQELQRFNCACGFIDNFAVILSSTVVQSIRRSAITYPKSLSDVRNDIRKVISETLTSDIRNILHFRHSNILHGKH